MDLPLPPLDLSTDDSRELALDQLGRWFTDALGSAGGDSERAAAIIALAISTFYDIREAADQLRGMYAGHFFLVDAVGLGESDRPIPWHELERRVTPEHLALYRDLFDRLERVTP